MTQKKINKSILKFVLIIIFIAIFVFLNNAFDYNSIKDLISNSQENINGNGIYIIFLIFLLRSISIFIPIIPGTYCVVIAGYIFGIKAGLIIMFFADFISCYMSFLISRRLGRGFVKQLLGSKQMRRVENIGQTYLEQNFFLMTGFLMTSWFDFVCYAVGLTKISWKKFMPALILSILISDIPFVAAGFGLSQLQDVGLRQVLNGEVDIINGPYLLILVFSAIIIFGIGLLNIALGKRKTSLNN